MSFYILKRSPGSFVWVTPMPLRGGPYLKIEEQPLERSQLAQIQTRHVYYGEKRAATEDIYFSNVQTQRVSLSIE
jgi:hypothetical protein